MANSWSFLHDELSMTEHSTHYYDYTRNDPNRENPFTSEDTVKMDGYSVNGSSIKDLPGGDTVIYGGEGTDTISFQAAQPVPMDDIFGLAGQDTISFDLNLNMNTEPNRYKYSEDEILKELQEYITGTYNQHYSAGDDKIQTLDLIEACGDGEAFCRSNILKYASRYDKKGTARRDIMKILHYAVLLMHFNDKNAKRETYPQ